MSDAREEDERVTAFYARAERERERMQKETDKMTAKATALRTQFGTERVLGWYDEHQQHVATAESSADCPQQDGRPSHESGLLRTDVRVRDNDNQDATRNSSSLA